MIATPELELAVECCRRNFQNAEPRPLPKVVDWDRLENLLRFHRIEGLAYRALQQEDSVPHQVADRLAETASLIAASNLRSIAVSESLREQFEQRGLAILFLKGLTIGALAYGTPAVKSAVDIDILIDPAELESVTDCLRGAGFSLVAPSRSLERWHRVWKESVWQQADGLQLDLHTRLADHPHLLAGLGVDSSSQTVTVSRGVALPTFTDEVLFVYLAVHGASAGWFRLKWVSDFAAFLATHSPSVIAEWYEGSRHYGANRAAGQALLLADTLFGSLVNLPDLAEKLRADVPTKRLSRLAFDLLSRDPAEPTEGFLGTLPIHVSQLALKSGVHFKLAQLRQQAHQLLTRLTI